ncbi:hypothetical protein BC567DRAFT_230844 [Phyllosticta citribraziliensis]
MGLPSYVAREQRRAALSLATELACLLGFAVGIGSVCACSLPPFFSPLPVWSRMKRTTQPDVMSPLSPQHCPSQVAVRWASASTPHRRDRQERGDCHSKAGSKRSDKALRPWGRQAPCGLILPYSLATQFKTAS